MANKVETWIRSDGTIIKVFVDGVEYGEHLAEGRHETDERGSYVSVCVWVPPTYREADHPEDLERVKQRIQRDRENEVLAKLRALESRIGKCEQVINNNEVRAEKFAERLFALEEVLNED